MNIAALYFSGTGNTQYVVESMRDRLAENGVSMRCFSIEAFDTAASDCLSDADTVLFAYPVYGSMAPRIMREFVMQYGSLLAGKNAIIIATQLLFSGDGSAFLARLLRPFGVRVIAMEHIDMPSNISDADIFRIKNGAENYKKIGGADRVINRFCRRLVSGRPIMRGRTVFSRLLGLLQRPYFRIIERRLAGAIKIDEQLCTCCSRCIRCCPVKNLYLDEKRVRHHSHCTLCYRCINLCPERAISLIKKSKPRVQYMGPAHKLKK